MASPEFPHANNKQDEMMNREATYNKTFGTNMTVGDGTDWMLGKDRKKAVRPLNSAKGPGSFGVGGGGIGQPR